jgi:hypothetical protein
MNFVDNIDVVASLLASLPFLAQVVFHPLYYHWDKRKNKRFDKWAIHMSNSGYLVSARLLGVAWGIHTLTTLHTKQHALEFCFFFALVCIFFFPLTYELIEMNFPF